MLKKKVNTFRSQVPRCFTKVFFFLHLALLLILVSVQSWVFVVVVSDTHAASLKSERRKKCGDIEQRCRQSVREYFWLIFVFFLFTLLVGLHQNEIKNFFECMFVYIFYSHRKYSCNWDSFFFFERHIQHSPVTFRTSIYLWMQYNLDGVSSCCYNESIG